jgi:HEAT repeat protein
MILCTGGILLALALMWTGWTIGTVAVPAWQARAALERFRGHPSEAGPEIERLGGPEAAARKVVVYLRLPKSRVPLKHRNKALDFLLACGKPAMPGMILLLKDPDEGIRIGAVELMTDELGEHMDESCVEPLIAALWDRCYDVRYRAAYGLGRLGDRRAVEPLIAALPDPELCRYAAEGLGRLAGRGAVEPLLATLGAGEDRAICEALADIARRDAAATEPLVAALEGPVAERRSAAAVALGKAGDRRAEPRLLAMFRENDPAWSGSAAEALGALRSKAAVEPLIAALKDRGRGLHTAVWALGRIGDPRALEPLRALLGDEGTDRTVCQAIDAILATQDSTSGGGK